MTYRAVIVVKQNVGRFALTGLVGIWLSGCSADTSRFAEPMANPFVNPFSTSSNDAAAPTPKVASSPANPNYVAAAHPNPVAVTALNPAPATTGQIRSPAAQPVGGSASGWSAVGGSPIIVADGDTLNVLSQRYGVPAAALMSANGLTSPTQVHGGIRLVVPVYNARTKTAAAEPVAAPRESKTELVKAEPQRKPKAAKNAASEVADKSDDTAKPKAKKKLEETVAQKVQVAAPRPVAKLEKPKAPASSAPVVAKAEPAAKPAPKKPAVDTAPIGNVHGAGTPPAAPLTGQQADAAGVTPEFRWPARGRIIQGFKSGGNDGINISVPEGTSVRAAENGTVAYAGSELKGYGNLVLIRHPNGFVTAYANNGELDVKRGDVVKRGQVIAKSGQSGNVSSPQLHFELRKGSTPVDPTSYLAGL